MSAPRKRRAAPFVVGALLLGAAAAFSYSRRRDAPLEVETIRVERGEVRELVTSAAAGEVKPARRVTVRAEVAATVAEVKKKRGDRVTAQEVIVAFRSDELDARLMQADANAEAAAVAVRMAEDRGKTAERSLERAKRLRASDAISEVELDRAEIEADASKHALSQARAAERQALAAKKLADVQKKRATVTAPFAGVIHDVFAEIGVQIAPGQALFDLIDDSVRFVEIPIDEADIARVAVGQRVTLRTDSYGAKTLSGVVSFIPPAVGRAHESAVPEANILSQKDRALFIRVTPDDTTGLFVGASVNAEILISSRNDVLFVPTHVVRGRGVERSVYRVDRGVVRKVAFKAGMTSWDRTEVLSGLELDNEIVSTLNLKGLDDGVRVKTKPVLSEGGTPEPAGDDLNATAGGSAQTR